MWIETSISEGRGPGSRSLIAPPNRAVVAAPITPQPEAPAPQHESGPADYTVRIQASPVEIAPNYILSTITYNGQFPGPLLHFTKAGKSPWTSTTIPTLPEQLHWHGQMVPTEVEGSVGKQPFVPARGQRRIVFTPRPAGFRFYHTHNAAACANLAAGQYTGQVGPVYIEPKHEPGRYDREVFLVLKEFEPTLSRGGDMAMDFLSPATQVKALVEKGESAMKASLAKGMPHGYEVGYRSFTIYGRKLGHGEPVPREAGRARLIPQPERQCHGNSQPCPARPHV